MCTRLPAVSSCAPLPRPVDPRLQISDVGGLALCRAAKAALVLSRLNLSLNNLTGSTLTAIAEALRFNTGTLKEVRGGPCVCVL